MWLAVDGAAIGAALGLEAHGELPLDNKLREIAILKATDMLPWKSINDAPVLARRPRSASPWAAGRMGAGNR
ncbi:MAG: hypothetical protein WDN49_05325 [Acetobacteraceae bacterium]